MVDGHAWKMLPPQNIESIQPWTTSGENRGTFAEKAQAGPVQQVKLRYCTEGLYILNCEDRKWRREVFLPIG